MTTSFRRRHRKEGGDSVFAGDAVAVAGHLAALREADPDLAETYRTMSLRAASYTRAPAALIEVLER